MQYNIYFTQFINIYCKICNVYITYYIYIFKQKMKEGRMSQRERERKEGERDSTTLRIISPQVICYYVFEPGSLVSLRLTD